MNINNNIQIPTYENGVWTVSTFDTRDAFRDFVVSIFKEPGKYKFNETSLKFNEQARLFNQQGFYCASPQGTKDFIIYWNDQKNKCRVGAIYKDGKDTWYIPRDYYMWLNFLPIFNKETQKFGFADVRVLRQLI